MKTLTTMNKQELEAAQKEFEAFKKQKEASAARAEKLRVKNTLLLKKAKEAGLQVSDAEVDAYIAAMPKK